MLKRRGGFHYGDGSVGHRNRPTSVSKICFCDLFWETPKKEDDFMIASKELGGGFNHSLFVPLPGEIIQFDYYFPDGLKPPTREIVTLIFQQISLLPVLRVG